MTSPRLINGITLATAIATYVRRAGLRHDSLLSHVRAAVREASGVADRHALLQVDIRPYLEALPDIAYKQALREGRSKPANHRSSAMRFIDVVLERTRDPHCERTSRRRGGRAAFLPAWWPLFDALWVRAGRNVPKGAASLETLQGLALRHGVRDPERLPDAFHTVAGWCSEAGLRDQMRTEILSVYRRARVAADRLDLPEIAPPAPEGSRGLQTLSNLEELVSAAAPRRAALYASKGQPAPPAPPPAAEIEVAELLDILAPRLSDAVRRYQHTAAESWAYQTGTRVGQLVAALHRLGPTRRIDGTVAPEDPFALDVPSLFVQQRLLPATVYRESGGNAGSDLLTDDADDSPYDTVPLIQVALDSIAKVSVRSSAITVDYEGDDVPFYNNATQQTLTAVWCLAKRIYGEQLSWPTKRPEEWARMEIALRATIARMDRLNRDRRPTGYIAKELVTLNWGQTVCVGVPVLWREAKAAQASYRALQSKGGGGSTLKTARARYFETMRRWALVSTVLDDGMRIKNYAFARLGSHFQPEHARDATGAVELGPDGQPRRISGMLVVFRGYDDQGASTKKKRTKYGAERRRQRHLGPGVVDLDLLRDYVYEVRPADLLASGLLADENAYDWRTDNFPFFTNPCHPRVKRRSKRGRSRPIDRVQGGYTTSHLSRNVFGKTLHWMHRDLLKLPDSEGRLLPPWSAIKAGGSRYRGLFSEHIVRSLMASYMIGVHGNTAEVVQRTDDTLESLNTFYAKHQAIAQGMKFRGSRALDWFKTTTERLIRGEIVDWHVFDPDRPAETTVVVAAQGGEVKRQRRWPRKRRAVDHQALAVRDQAAAALAGALS